MKTRTSRPPASSSCCWRVRVLNERPPAPRRSRDLHRGTRNFAGRPLSSSSSFTSMIAPPLAPAVISGSRPPTYCVLGMRESGGVFRKFVAVRRPPSIRSSATRRARGSPPADASGTRASPERERESVHFSRPSPHFVLVGCSRFLWRLECERKNEQKA